MRTRLAGLVCVVVAVGCAEEPSYTLRWELVSDQIDIDHCSEVGVSKIEVLTLAGSVPTLLSMASLSEEDLVDVREHPCQVDGVVDGPTLEPGDYTVYVAGQRRSGEWWPCSEDEPECYAAALAEVRVPEDPALRPEVSVVLLAPPQCDDGIDNDQDGRVDDRDPACLLPSNANAAGLEDAEKGLSLFQLTASFLASEVVLPINVSVDALRLTVTGGGETREYVVDAPELMSGSDNVSLDLGVWPYRLPLLSDELAPGTYQLSAVALDRFGVALTEAIGRTDPLDGAEVFEFSVTDDRPAFVLGELEFTADRFLDPILAPIALDPLLETAASLTHCQLGGYIGGQNGTIERLWLRVRDEADQPVDLATLGFDVPDAVSEADGFVSFACPSFILRSLDLTWGSYRVDLEARNGADACFAREDQALAPFPGGGAQTVILERVLIDGAVPDACIECVVDTDCRNPNETFCKEGVCVPEEQSGG